VATSSSEGQAGVRRWQAPAVAGSAQRAQGVFGPVTAEQIEAIEAQAREQGYARGLSEGRAEGRAQMQAAADRLDGLMASLDPLAACSMRRCSSSWRTWW
jgi:flagellar assembly protein FliH